MILVIAPALDGLRREWREAALNLGAGPSQYWRHVALPVLMPSLLGAILLLFGSAFGAYATAYALTSGQLPLVPLLIGQVETGNVLSDPISATCSPSGWCSCCRAWRPELPGSLEGAVTCVG